MIFSGIMYKDGYPLPYVEEMLETVKEFEGMPIKLHLGEPVGFIKYAWIDDKNNVRMVGQLYKSVDLRDFGIGVSYLVNMENGDYIAISNHSCVLLEKLFAVFECELVNLTKKIHERMRFI